MNKTLLITAILIGSFFNAQSLTINELISIRKSSVQDAIQMLTNSGWIYSSGKPSSTQDFGLIEFEKDEDSKNKSNLTLHYKDKEENVLTITTPNLILYNEYLDYVKSLQPEYMFTAPLENRLVTGYNARKIAFIFTISSKITEDNSNILNYTVQLFEIDDFAKRYIEKGSN